jgi:hypothetical protein
VFSTKTAVFSTKTAVFSAKTVVFPTKIAVFSAITENNLFFNIIKLNIN